MINQQLLDYIRQQLTGGVAREIIKTNLMSQGWSEQDIAEGFITIDKSTVPPVPQAPIPTSPIQPIVPPQSATILNEKMSMPSTVAPTSVWVKGIPRTNNVFMVISLLLVFGLDLFIIISSPDLRPFWYMMLGVLAVFAVFFCLENFVFSKKFADTSASVDKGISVVVVLRNLLFILNFIPFIQLLGLAAIVYGGWILGIIYIGLIIARFNQTKKTG